MNIGLFARGDGSDAAATHWMAAHCRAADDVHVIAPYAELAVAGCAWTPAVRAADEHRNVARRLAATLAGQITRTAAEPVEVGYSAVPGSRAHVLAAFAECCDLLVVGVPALAQVSDPITQAAYALDEAARNGAAQASVVLVPEAWHGGRGAVVLVGTREHLGAHSLRAGISAAMRLGAPLCLLTRRSSDAPDSIVDGPDADGLDQQGRDTVAHAADLGVEIAYRSSRHAVTDSLRTMGGVALVVTDCSDRGRWHTVRDSAAVALGELVVPTMLVGPVHDAVSTAPAAHIMG